jgi:hypothetical protein
VGAGPFSVTVGDFNGDGRQDLATANFSVNTVSLLLGRGNGTFQAAQDFEVGAGPSSITVGDFNGDGRQDVATANVEVSTVSILLNDTPGVVVNDLVTFEPIGATFHFTEDATGCPPGFVGIFRFEARLTNVSERSLADLGVAVTRLTQGNLLQNADGGPGDTGARLTVPRADGFAEGILSPEEFVEVPFLICVTARRPFTFEVAVVGDAE